MGKRTLTFLGFGLGCISTLLTIIGFSTSFWLEGRNDRINRDIGRKFVRIGLWEACFNKFASRNIDNLGKVYDGCQWILHYDYRPILDWLVPSWFLAVQVMMTLCMVLSLVACILCLIGLLGYCPGHRAACAQLINSVLMFVAAALETISVITFGVQSDTDSGWIRRADQTNANNDNSNNLSWSFGMVVVAAFITIFSGMFLLVDSLRLSANRRKARAPLPQYGRRGYEYEMDRGRPYDDY